MCYSPNLKFKLTLFYKNLTISGLSLPINEACPWTIQHGSNRNMDSFLKMHWVTKLFPFPLKHASTPVFQLIYLDNIYSGVSISLICVQIKNVPSFLEDLINVKIKISSGNHERIIF